MVLKSRSLAMLRLVTSILSSRPAVARDKLSLGFFRRLVTPPEEKAFVDGLRALHERDEDGALSKLEAARELSDFAWMAGMIRLKREAFSQAHTHSERALAAGDRLGAQFLKYNLAPQISLPIAKGTRSIQGSLDQFCAYWVLERGSPVGSLLVPLFELDPEIVEHLQVCFHVVRGRLRYVPTCRHVVA